MAMSLADANLIIGYSLEILEARMSKALLEVAPLNALGDVPTHDQMTGYVLYAYIAAHLQGITLEPFCTCVPKADKTDLGLSHHLAGQAEGAAGAQGDPHCFTTSEQAAELPPPLPFGVNLLAFTTNTGQLYGALLKGKDHLAAFVSVAQVLVASHPETMVQETMDVMGIILDESY